MKKLSPTILLAAGSLLVFSIAGCGAADAPMKVTTKTSEGTFVDQMVAKAGGDPGKLTPEERTKMDAITRGHTDLVLQSGTKK